MMDKPIHSGDLRQIQQAVAEIARLQDFANAAVEADSFFAGADTRSDERAHTQFNEISFAPVDFNELRRVVLRSIWRKVDVQVKRCAAMGVPIHGYGDSEVWINSVLKRTKPAMSAA